MLKNCYYDNNNMRSFNNIDPFHSESQRTYCNITANLCKSCSNFCAFNGRNHKQKNCSFVDSQVIDHLKNNLCDTIVMCSSGAASIQYVSNISSVCSSKCSHLSSIDSSSSIKSTTHFTSSILETSQHKVSNKVSSSNVNLINPTSSIAIIPTTSGELLLDKKHDLTNSVSVPTPTLDSTKVDLTNSVSVPTPTLESTKVDLTSSLVKPTSSYGEEVKNTLIKQIGKDTNQDKSDSITDSDLFIPMVATGSVLVAASVVIGVLLYKMFTRNSIDEDYEME